MKVHDRLLPLTAHLASLRR